MNTIERPKVSFLEAVLARGTEGLGVLRKAWEKGCTFDDGLSI